MTDPIVHHRTLELDYHDQALRAEFTRWHSFAAESARLEKHHSQIERITSQLSGALDKIKAEERLNAVEITASGERERHILGIYRIWSYFREKFALRESELFFNLLKIADELAWACYRPARQAALQAGTITEQQRREPPLVFFSGDISPFVLERGRSFLPDGLNTRADIRHFDRVLFKLPVPLVAIPWFQLNHLPACVVMAHEIGHAVEVDFGLSEPLQRMFAGLLLPEARKTLWGRWREELFADVWGLLCCGPGYLIVLSEFLIGERQAVQTEARRTEDDDRYPTRMLRLLFNEAVLRRFGLLTAPENVHSADEPQQLEKLVTGPLTLWRDTYAFHSMEHFAADVDIVLDALFSFRFVPFGNKRLDEVVQFDAADLKASWLVARRLRSKAALNEARFHRLFCGISLYWQWQPERYLANAVHAWLVDGELLRQIPEGKRGTAGIGISPAEQSQFDQEAGEALLDLL